MKCFYHNDMDGRCAGAIVAQYENNYNPEDFFEVDYLMDLTPMLNKIEEGEKVYFVDYSFKDNTEWVLEKLWNMDCDIVWCDHHISSLNLEDQMPRLKNLDGIRRDKISGAALTYMYLHNCEFDDLPYYIKLVSDYDCWIYNFDPDTTYFKIGLESEKYDALDNVWKNLMSDEDNPVDDYFVRDIISKGEIIKGYIDRDHEQYRNQFAYESIIGGNKALVVNRKTNSWIFGDKYNKYPLVCVWAFNGTRYSYSIFSSNPNVDCSKIAESYGGGGHKGAAGFSSDELLFKRMCAKTSLIR